MPLQKSGFSKDSILLCSHFPMEVVLGPQGSYHWQENRSQEPKKTNCFKHALFPSA